MAPRRPDKKSKKRGKEAISRVAAAAAGGPSSSSSSDKPALSPLVLVRAAEHRLQEGDAPGAAALAGSALEQAQAAGDNDDKEDGALAALNLLGQVNLELGDLEAARACFLRAVDADPDGARDEAVGGGAEKFLCLAQLSEEGGRDSVRWFEKGAAALRARIQILEEEKAGKGTSTTRHSPRGAAAGGVKDDDAEEMVGQQQLSELEELKRKLAMTLCSVAEVYMTDLSWESDAEARCEALVTEATLVAPDYAETWQTLADVRISQQRPDDARAALARSLDLWRGLPPEDPLVPAFPSRVALARLLMEVGLERDAIDVLERLVAEDDLSIETWYLGGWGLFVLGEKQREAEREKEKNGGKKVEGATKEEEGEEEDWKTSWISSRVWLNQCLHLYKLQDYEDEPLGEHARELLGEIAKELGEAPVGEDDDEDGWEDAGDSDEEMQE
ncbi:hypothetical protein DL766_007011 [Monosporascus sp. MC13-8B]|uniref:TPR domain-containing protein n=1 Tax=Monosporascus cannonballus TaxID=155416 RepID=A0ABY0HG20_9PEZI|nr:hypothetical protein DL762_001553 [Monosporascus cannonballus]RYO94638.1 hypothetical protein DL763_004005 [Monosporascus cannonballus]RYP25529.1 hypothetical protein DL766_007011 [Monosporascus sp. MC13-8B]